MKKISFSDKFGLTRAVLEGRKTMTRRIIPLKVANHVDWKAFEEGERKCWDADTINDRWYDPILAATYKPGEVVAVAQAYGDIMAYLADSFYQPDPSYMRDKAGWNNKMFVKADLMPHNIRITNVKVERLQDISDEDCLQEGIWKDLCPTYFNGYGFDMVKDDKGNALATQWYKTPREAFAALIDKICSKGTWEANPFVFVYEFELVR